MEGDGSVRKAGHVIVAVTPPAAVRLLRDDLDEQRRFMESVLYVTMPMPVFFLDRSLRRDVWCYFNDPCQIRTFMFAIDALAKVPDMCPSGKSILTAWAHHPTTLELMKKTDEQLLREAEEDLHVMIPGGSQWIEDARVFRHPFVNAIYPPGSYQRPPPPGGFLCERCSGRHQYGGGDDERRFCSSEGLFLGRYGMRVILFAELGKAALPGNEAKRSQEESGFRNS